MLLSVMKAQFEKNNYTISLLILKWWLLHVEFLKTVHLTKYLQKTIYSYYILFNKSITHLSFKLQKE